MYNPIDVLVGIPLALLALYLLAKHPQATITLGLMALIGWFFGAAMETQKFAANSAGAVTLVLVGALAVMAMFGAILEWWANNKVQE